MELTPMQEKEEKKQKPCIEVIDNAIASKNLKMIEEARKKAGLPPLEFGREARNKFMPRGKK